MKTTTKLKTALMAAVSCAALATSVQAAPIGLDQAAPTMSVSSFTLDVLSFGTSTDLSAFALAFSSSTMIATTGSEALEFGVSYDASASPISASGFFDIVDGSSSFLSGDVTDIGYTESTLEFAFDVAGGTAAGEFSSTVLMEFDFSGSGIVDPILNLVAGSSYVVDIKLSSVVGAPPVATVPLPATSALLLGSLGVFAVARRRKSRQA